MPFLDYFREATSQAPPQFRRPSHPYFPRNIDVGIYIEHERKATELLALSASSFTLLAVALWWSLSKAVSRLRPLDKSIAVWFVLTGVIHVVFEGYWVYNHELIGGKQDILGQLWKEYALSDSRYMTSDSFVLAAETLSATGIGPLSLLTAWLVASRSSYRHQCQALVSTLHIYSDVLYYATSMQDYYHKRITHCRPEPYYFYVYYVGMNAIWIVVPLGRSSLHPSRQEANVHSSPVAKYQGHKSCFCSIRSDGDLFGSPQICFGWTSIGRSENVLIDATTLKREDTNCCHRSVCTPYTVMNMRHL